MKSIKYTAMAYLVASTISIQAMDNDILETAIVKQIDRIHDTLLKPEAIEAIASSIDGKMSAYSNRPSLNKNMAELETVLTQDDIVKLESMTRCVPSKGMRTTYTSMDFVANTDLFGIAARLMTENKPIYTVSHGNCNGQSCTKRYTLPLNTVALQGMLDRKPDYAAAISKLALFIKAVRPDNENDTDIIHSLEKLSLFRVMEKVRGYNDVGPAIEPKPSILPLLKEAKL